MQFLQKIPPWCDKMPKINLRDRGFIGLRKWNLGVVTSQEELLLKGQKVYPEVLIDSGFSFQFADLKTALENI